MTSPTIRRLQARCLRNAAHLAGDRQEKRRLRAEAARVAAGQGVLTTTPEGVEPDGQGAQVET
jgi:hypothetical protein